MPMRQEAAEEAQKVEKLNPSQTSCHPLPPDLAKCRWRLAFNTDLLFACVEHIASERDAPPQALHALRGTVRKSDAARSLTHSHEAAGWCNQSVGAAPLL